MSRNSSNNNKFVGHLPAKFLTNFPIQRSSASKNMTYQSLHHVWVFCLVFIVLANSFPAKMDENYPPPFTRELQPQDPPMKGKDVTILQSLLARSPLIKHLTISGVFDNETRGALAFYQVKNNLKGTGCLDTESAVFILNHLMFDGYKDDGKIEHGYKFKLYIPVHKDRNIETTAKLYNASNQVVYSFTVRTHGHDDLNQLSTNGNTPTGLATCDLNSPEPSSKSFGPYPVLRQVKGLKGNVAIGPNANDTFIPYIRYGILLHTGEWENWQPSQPMPNSNGCIHAHPSDQKKVIEILTQNLGVEVRKNPFGSLPYPYIPQGLLSIEQIDDQ